MTYEIKGLNLKKILNTNDINFIDYGILSRTINKKYLS